MILGITAKGHHGNRIRSGYELCEEKINTLYGFLKREIGVRHKKSPRWVDQWGLVLQ